MARVGLGFSRVATSILNLEAASKRSMPDSATNSALFSRFMPEVSLRTNALSIDQWLSCR